MFDFLKLLVNFISLCVRYVHRKPMCGGYIPEIITACIKIYCRTIMTSTLSYISIIGMECPCDTLDGKFRS
jgi:hypothetical protein